MKLDLIQSGIQKFSTVLQSPVAAGHVYKYALVDNFNKTWTFDTEDFRAVYDSALSSDATRRWWKRDGYRPKEMMMLLIGLEEQYVRQAFKELFNESKLIDNRIDSFIFYCDELLRMYKKANPTRIENNHYQDSAMISLYLSGAYAEKYTIYPGRTVFNAALRALNAKESIDKDDLPRYFKLTQTLYQFLMKDARIKELLESGIRPERNLLLVHEFIYFLADRYQESNP